MNYCSCCDEPKQKKELSKCEGCGQDVCVACCVKVTPHNMVDFTFCTSCESLNEGR